MNTIGIAIGTWVLFASSVVIHWLAFHERSLAWRIAYFTLGLGALLLAVQGAMKL